MPVEHIKYTDVLRDGTDKLNLAIDAANKAEVDSSTALNTANSATVTANEAKTTADTVRSEFDQVVAEAGSNNPEVVNARGPHAILKDRLDSVDAQLADIAINVKNFGAVGDGVTDNTQKIQDAIDYVSTLGGGTVLIPTGVYLFSSNINLKDNIVLIGASKYKTVLKATSSNISRIAVHDVKNVVLRNFTLDANNKPCRVAVQAITSDVENIIIDHVIVKNSGTVNDNSTWHNNIQVKRFGIYNVKDIWLTNLYCENAAGDGTSYGDNIAIESYGSDGTGKLTNIIIENCILKKAGRQNISLAGDDTESKPSEVMINNVICEDSSLAGIDFEEVDKVTISNVHFINSGKYTGFYNGSHFAELNPTSIMRSGISLHTENNGVVSNSIFTNCHYGVGGFGDGLVVSNCKFFDSKISNGDLSAAGRWLFNNCEIVGEGNVNYLVDSYLGRLKFSNCNFKGTTTTNYMIRLLSADSTTYRGNSFSHCEFFGQDSLSMNVFYVQYGWYEIKNCIFNKINIAFNFYQSSGLVNINISNNQFFTVNTIIDSAYIALSSLNFIGNHCESIKKVAKFNSHVKDLKFTNNIIKMKLDTGDGFEHIGIGNNSNQAGMRSFYFSNNNCINTGSATDVLFLRLDIRSTEVSTEMVNITNNQFKNFSKAIGVYLYSGSSNAQSGIIVGNEGKSVTTLIDTTNGFDANKLVAKENLNEGVLINWNFPRISGTTAQRPTNVLAGYRYYDTDTSSSIVWTGSTWV